MEARGAGTSRGVGKSRAVGGLVFVVLGVAFLLEDYGVWRVDLVYVWPLILIGFGTSVLLGRAERMRAEEDRSAQLAVAEERVRIARELHDIVAHSVSLMTIQISAARRVFSSKPDAAQHALAQAEQTGRQSLTELRNLLNVLRSADASIEAARPGDTAAAAEPAEAGERSPLPGLADIATLVDAVRETGIDATFEEVGERGAVPGSIALVVYRVIQEALTNVLRHAGATSVRVTVLHTADAVEVWVDDDGRSAYATVPRAETGHGLMGMRERVEAVQGTIDVGPRSGGAGWQVHAWVPIEGSGQ